MHPAIIIGTVRSLIVDVAMGQIPRSTERISSYLLLLLSQKHNNISGYYGCSGAALEECCQLVTGSLQCQDACQQVCYPNSIVFSERELTFTFAICRRPSVCRLSVCNVRAPYSGD